MIKNNSLKLVFGLLFILPYCKLLAVEQSPQDMVIKLIQQTESQIKTQGKEKSIVEFRKKSSRIFVINYDGMVLASPLHPEMVGTNQFNYKDASGELAVQEEIKQAQTGGGWVKGRFRMNSDSGKYACRKLYIQSMPGNYFIGSWYYYPATKKDSCPI